MKSWSLIIGIIVIFALVCSPVLAISKSDLISQYKGQSAPTIPTWTPTPIATIPPPPTSVTSVTSTPTRAMVFIDGSYEGLTPITIWSKLAVGSHRLKVSRPGYEDYYTEFLIREPSCHVSYGGSVVCEVQPIIINVTLKKVESTQKLTIPTIVPSPKPTMSQTDLYLLDLLARYDEYLSNPTPPYSVVFA